MSRKKFEEGSIKEQNKAELNDRISQIRQTFCEDNNREFSELINVNYQALSQICSGKRNAGLEIVQKILDNLPEIDANWLLRGKGNMTIDRSGKNVSVQDSPQATVSNGDMTINAPAELLILLTSQQETIKRLTEIIANNNKKN